MSKALLITGATGKQGGSVIDALLSQASSTSSQTNPQKFTILAVTRDPSSPASQRLLRKSNPEKGVAIKLVKGNLDDIPALFASAKEALKSTTSPSLQIHGVYSVQVSLGPGVTVQGEINQGKSLIDGAIANGVRHFVYSSVERGGDEHSWNNTTPIPHFQTKHAIEHHLRDVSAIKTLGGDDAEDAAGKHMEWTILRPVAFMDNLAPGMPTKVFLAAMKNHIGDKGKKVQWVATKDIGVFAAKAFTSPEEWKNRAVGLAGDELDMEGLDRSFMRATGRNVPLGYGFMGSILTWAVKEMGLMIGWFADEGYKADIEARRKEHPGMLTMEMWLAQEDSPFAAGDTN
ncbi:putative negative transcriptional regulator [Rhypophila decipiens]|uniref:Negative transcriptional regulator n=1 Tax=Rhypophila decipiens TaxID=261697 RepID=A0AAN6XYK0_9PEZI|nr:putative negative transcriptional regulator [Rhypophila decipiens]